MAIALDGGFREEPAGRLTSTPWLGTLGHEPDDDTRATTLAFSRNASQRGGAAALAAGQVAQTDSMSPAQDADDGLEMTDSDICLVKQSFTYLLANPRQSMEYFYAHLFAQNPEIRALFPLEMSPLRDRVFAALARLVWSLDVPETRAALLRQIGRDHRKFGVKDSHLDAFFASLRATAEHLVGPQWTASEQAAWGHVLHYASRTMRTAMHEDARSRPAWWLGEVVRHELRCSSVAVLTIRPDQVLPYEPGQYVDVQVTRWPRLWRSYSVANAPRRDGLLDLHVRAVPGGLVSNALVHHVEVGDSVLLGPPKGSMTVSAAGSGEVLCVAGGTGLAPVKALVEGVIKATRLARRRTVTLLLGARSQAELYDMRDLIALADEYPSLSVIPVISAEPTTAYLTGTLPEIVASREIGGDCEVLISGPPPMVTAAERALAGRVPAAQVHHDPLDGLSASGAA